jgi:hypothetical protein
MNKEELMEHLYKMKNDPDYAAKYKQDIKLERDRRTREYWETLNPFVNEDDVPELPNPLNTFYEERLIELGAIPKNKLEVDNWYYGNHRRCQFAKWNGDKFIYYRYKFGWRLDECNHFQDDDGFALFVPIRIANKEDEKKIREIKKEYEDQFK